MTDGVLQRWEGEAKRVRDGDRWMMKRSAWETELSPWRKPINEGGRRRDITTLISRCYSSSQFLFYFVLFIYLFLVKWRRIKNKLWTVANGHWAKPFSGPIVIVFVAAWTKIRFCRTHYLGLAPLLIHTPWFQHYTPWLHLSFKYLV